MSEEVLFKLQNVLTKGCIKEAFIVQRLGSKTVKFQLSGLDGYFLRIKEDGDLDYSDILDDASTFLWDFVGNLSNPVYLSCKRYIDRLNTMGEPSWYLALKDGKLIGNGYRHTSAQWNIIKKPIDSRINNSRVLNGSASSAIPVNPPLVSMSPSSRSISIVITRPKTNQAILLDNLFVPTYMGDDGVNSVRDEEARTLAGSSISPSDFNGLRIERRVHAPAHDIDSLASLRALCRTHLYCGGGREVVSLHVLQSQGGGYFLLDSYLDLLSLRSLDVVVVRMLGDEPLDHTAMPLSSCTSRNRAHAAASDVSTTITTPATEPPLILFDPDNQNDRQRTSTAFSTTRTNISNTSGFDWSGFDSANATRTDSDNRRSNHNFPLLQYPDLNALPLYPPSPTHQHPSSQIALVSSPLSRSPSAVAPATALLSRNWRSSSSTFGTVPLSLTQRTPTGADMTPDYPEPFTCPIGFDLMSDPVVCTDGHSYERVNIEAWLSQCSRSPKTNEELSSRALIPNHALRTAIELFRSQANSLKWNADWSKVCASDEAPASTE